MSQRHSEYERMAGDAYWTPDWVFQALYSVEQFNEPWDCAPRDGKYDFLADDKEIFEWRTEIVTNPPFSKAEAFCRRAVVIARKVAMLLPIAFDAAKTRRDLFEKEPFKAKYVITRRIRWENLEQKKNGPSTNHAWYVWEKGWEDRPFLGWLP